MSFPVLVYNQNIDDHNILLWKPKNSIALTYIQDRREGGLGGVGGPGPAKVYFGRKIDCSLGPVQ